MPALVLPLVHHFMEERFESFPPSVAPHVSPADNDLGTGARAIAVRVVPKPALHPPRDPNWNRSEHASELLIVQQLVRAAKLRHQLLIVRMITLRRPVRVNRRLLTVMDVVLDQHTFCRVPHRARSPMHESDDRAQRVFLCVEIPSMQPKLIVRVAHEHSAIRRQPAAVAAIEPQS